MKIILTTNIKKLGKIGEVVSVKDGFARNYLFPNNMALRNTKKNSEYYDNIKDNMIEKEKNKLDDAKNLISEIDEPAKSRWPLDNKAPYMKGAGLKL